MEAGSREGVVVNCRRIRIEQRQPKVVKTHLTAGLVTVSLFFAVFETNYRYFRRLYR